jgi:hypothetical protein
MTIGQREEITYRETVRDAQSGPFLPAHGVGSGLDDSALGLTLDYVVRSPTRFRTMHRTVVGVVIAEDTKFVTLELRNEHKLKIALLDIIERTVVA